LGPLQGIGFFDAGNFFPDFIIRLVDGDTQYVSFLDPKGLGRVGIEDPKVNFYQTIKQLEKDLGDQYIHLNSFILSNTRLADMPQFTAELIHNEWEKRNVFFQIEDKENYMGKFFKQFWIIR
jgi:hypothetical protein